MHTTAIRRRSLLAAVGAGAGLVVPLAFPTAALAHRYTAINVVGDRGVVDANHTRVYACNVVDDGHAAVTYYRTAHAQGSVRDTTTNGNCPYADTGEQVREFKVCTEDVADSCTRWIRP